MSWSLEFSKWLLALWSVGRAPWNNREGESRERWVPGTPPSHPITLEPVSFLGLIEDTRESLPYLPSMLETESWSILGPHHGDMPHEGGAQAAGIEAKLVPEAARQRKLGKREGSISPGRGSRR